MNKGYLKMFYVILGLKINFKKRLWEKEKYGEFIILGKTIRVLLISNPNLMNLSNLMGESFNE
jgi:hypothetical protein